MKQSLYAPISRMCYGYKKDDNGELYVDIVQGKTVEMIFDKYLQGYSLSGLQTWLGAEQVSSPTGKGKWTRAALDKLLSNQNYIPFIIDADRYHRVQAEKKRRSNVEQAESGASRKQTRYNSTNTLSGLIVCAECGANYRRITRPDGSIVWCCANRVEHGKRICKHSPTISEESAIKLLGLQPAQLEPHNIVSRLPQPRHYHKGSPSCLAIFAYLGNVSSGYSLFAKLSLDFSCAITITAIAEYPYRRDYAVFLDAFHHLGHRFLGIHMERISPARDMKRSSSY